MRRSGTPGDDDDDGIPLAGMTDGSDSPRSTCWCCQRPVIHGQAVEVSGKTYPVCLTCWGQIPNGDRVSLALKLHSGVDLIELVRIATTAMGAVHAQNVKSVSNDLFGGTN